MVWQKVEEEEREMAVKCGLTEHAAEEYFMIKLFPFFHFLPHLTAACATGRTRTLSHGIQRQPRNARNVCAYVHKDV